MEKKKFFDVEEESSMDISPVSLENRTLGKLSTFAIWFTTDLVVSAVLTGMYMVPSIDVATALKVIIIGTIIGVIPLVLIGVMGSKTGLTSIVLTRAIFGIKGSYIFAFLNSMILIAWSWAQAGMGGIAINYIVKSLTGYDNPTLFVILVEVLVIFVVVFAVKGISTFEKIGMVLIAAVMGAVIIKAVSSVGFSAILDIPASKGYGDMTVMACFDLVIASCIAFAPLVADYNRNCKSTGIAVACTGIGFSLGTILSLSTGAIMIGMVMAGGMEVIYEPSTAYGQIGFELLGPFAIVVSIIAANVMCLYSATISIVSIVPKFGYIKTLFLIGIVCVIGAVFSGILDSFISFISLIGVVFLPAFIMVITDFFIIKKCKVNIDAYVYPEKDKSYWFTGGINWLSIGVYVVCAGTAYYWSQINPLSIGANIPTIILTAVLYTVVSKIAMAVKKR